LKEQLVKADSLRLLEPICAAKAQISSRIPGNGTQNCFQDRPCSAGDLFTIVPVRLEDTDLRYDRIANYQQFDLFRTSHSYLPEPLDADFP
jgi:hypothetical protein